MDRTGSQSEGRKSPKEATVIFRIGDSQFLDIFFIPGNFELNI
jgi:hypothetical protein